MAVALQWLANANSVENKDKIKKSLREFVTKILLTDIFINNDYRGLLLLFFLSCNQLIFNRIAIVQINANTV